MKETERFGEYVFSDAVMRERLPKKIYQEVQKAREGKSEMTRATADVVAHAMMDWAVEHGATHYTHWFQPLNGITAEKHDAFISNMGPDGKMILEFSGKELIKGEPDASSFPTGGLRSTFEARGYTAWDFTSPAFLKENTNGITLCIPTAFCSYTGEALDTKTPLLRSMEAISKQALRIVHLFGNTTASSVTPSVGPEQEYFIVDKNVYLQRKDLIYTGRTLFGAMPPKGQEMDDHYFGSIPKRVGAFMQKVDEELWRMGVTSKTEHNEVAPAQHELAPIYAPCNIAVDHNQIIMATLKKVAADMNLVCLLHEKPFAGVNGSGKHNNWSLTTDEGDNLLDPGKTPHANVQFLLVLSCILKAVDEHADLLRFSAANVGNDHRLGANEAPPAIVSVFLGSQLTDVMTQMIASGMSTSSIQGEKLQAGSHSLAVFTKDATDRNRTSPFAFTGNKFEFRMVGSSDTVSTANTVLNTIVAEAFEEAADILENAENFELAVHDLIKKNMTEHQRIVFNGNGYSPEWVEEAARRGLPNIGCMVDAIPVLLTEKSRKLFAKYGVFNDSELESRAEVLYETYAKTINIEGKTMIDMASKHIIPAVMDYIADVASGMGSVMDVCEDADVSVQREIILECSDLLSDTKHALEMLKNAVTEASKFPEGEEAARAYRSLVVPAMDALRRPVDELEMLVDKEMWPMPSYGDLMFNI